MCALRSTFGLRAPALLDQQAEAEAEAEAEAGAGAAGLQEDNTCSYGSNPEKKSVFWTCSSIQQSLANNTNQSEENIK